LTCITKKSLLNGECSVDCGTNVDTCSSDKTIIACNSGFYKKLTTDTDCTACSVADAN